MIISGFYESITARDTALYLRTLWLSLLIVLAVAVTKARSAQILLRWPICPYHTHTHTYHTL